MSLALPGFWAQAAGFVAVGYALRSAVVVNEKDVQVSIRTPSTAPCIDSHLEYVHSDTSKTTCNAQFLMQHLQHVQYVNYVARDMVLAMHQFTCNSCELQAASRFGTYILAPAVVLRSYLG